MKYWLGCFLYICSYLLLAQTANQLGFFIKHESHDENYINGLGTEIWLLNQDSNLGVSINTVLGNAKVLDKNHHAQSYLAWDFGIKFGYFSKVFVYGELGVDMGELLLQDRDEDSYQGSYQDSYHDDDTLVVDIAKALLADGIYQRNDQSNDIDTYIGAGVGVNFEQLAIEVYARYRQIDGEYWQAHNQVFSGIRVTLMF